MAENIIFDKLSVLQNVYSNSLPNVQQDKQYDRIKTKLYPHQRNMVEGMYLHREKLTRGFLSDNQAIHGKIGIVADPPGTGKTLSVLAYLAGYSKQCPKMNCELTPTSSQYFFSHDIHVADTLRTANILIVPHYLYQHWIHEIQTHTTLPYCGIETKHALQNEECARKMLESVCVITTNKCFKSVQQYASDHQIVWNNVFIDEASSIYIKSSDPRLHFQFLWFITNNWIPLLFKNPFLSKIDLYHLRDRLPSLHPDVEEWLLDNQIPHYESSFVSSHYLKDYMPFLHRKKYYIVLRNTNECIKNSIQLPPYSTETYLCRPNVTLQSFASYMSSHGMDITVQNIPYIVQVLNIDCSEVDTYMKNKPSTVHTLIQTKVMENECVICMEHATYPMIVNCCYNIYCGRCILTHMMINPRCPTCREPLGTNTICCLNTVWSQEPRILKSKMEACVDIIRQHEKGRFIIYSSFDNIYFQLSEHMNMLGLKAERIENNLYSLLRSWKNYQEGRTHVLFVSNIELIRGMSLHSTSHLIFYHELSSYEWKQVLIHSAQRIGRQESLNLIHLDSELQV